MNKPKVTIGMCVHDPSAIFTSIVSSWLPILDQGHELLIYDDGSKSPIKNLIQSENTNRIRIIRSELNKGIGHGRQVIYLEAKYDLIAFADADDFSHPERIETSIKKLIANSKINHANLVYASSEKRYETGLIVQEQTTDNSLGINELIKRQTSVSSESFITPASVLMFSRSEVNTAFDVNFHRLEDIEWLWHINTKMPLNLISTDSVLVYRYDEIKSSVKTKHNDVSEIKLFEKYSSIIGGRLTKLNLDWFRLKSMYFMGNYLALFRLLFVFIMRYKIDGVRKILIGGERRMKKC